MAVTKGQKLMVQTLGHDRQREPDIRKLKMDGEASGPADRSRLTRGDDDTSGEPATSFLIWENFP